jgi:hypothetical protein
VLLAFTPDELKSVRKVASGFNVVIECEVENEDGSPRTFTLVGPRGRMNRAFAFMGATPGYKQEQEVRAPMPKPEGPQPKRGHRLGWIVAGVLALIIGAVVSAGQDGLRSPSLSSSGVTKQRPMPADDVKVSDLMQSDGGMWWATVKTNNHSAMTSDYRITIMVGDDAGSRLADNVAVVSNLRPGEANKQDIAFMPSDYDTDHVTQVKVLRVERTAS